MVSLNFRFSGISANFNSLVHGDMGNPMAARSWTAIGMVEDTDSDKNQDVNNEN